MDDYGSAEGWLQSERKNSEYWYAQAESLRADAEKYRRIVELEDRVNGAVSASYWQFWKDVSRIIKEGA